MQQTPILPATETKVQSLNDSNEKENNGGKNHVVIQKDGKSKNFSAGLDLERLFQSKWFYNYILLFYVLSAWHLYPVRITEGGLRDRKIVLEEHKLDTDQSDASLFPFQSWQKGGQCLFSMTGH